MSVLSDWTPRMMTVAMAADELGISIPRVHQLIADKRLTPVLQAGKTYLLDSQEVKKLKAIDRPTGRPSKAAVEQHTKEAQAQPVKRTRAAITTKDIRGLADKNLGKK